jgi:uncharacterized protein (DUF1015 family)
MAIIRPFKGIHYDTDLVGSLDRVISPPYDVITPAQRDTLYARGEYNFVRIILNRSEPGDKSVTEPYMRAAHLLDAWLETGVFVQDEEESFYVYEQEFTNPLDGERLSRLGLFCALKLSPYEEGVVLPHEETRKKAKEDRLQLMRATSANTEPIFGLYEDDKNSVRAELLYVMKDSNPMLMATVGDEIERVWRISDPVILSRISDMFKEASIWIADGHHRYETGLNYRDERRKALSSPPPDMACDYILAILSGFHDPGLVVLPTHRLVRNIPSSRLANLPNHLRELFDVERMGDEELLARLSAPTDAHRFGMVIAQGAYLLTLMDLDAAMSRITGHAEVWKKLDVSLLQELILSGQMGITAEQLTTTPDIAYTRDPHEALTKVADGEFQVAFILSPPHADDVRHVALSHEKMPPKSTYFYPKQWSGLLLRKV